MEHLPRGIERITDEGNDLMDAGEIEAAATKFREALALDDRHALSWYNLGVTQYAAGNDDAAVVSFQKAVERDPALVKAWNNMGMALLRLNRVEAADEAFDRAIGVDPDYPKSYVGKGSVRMMNDDFGNARRFFAMALERDPTSVVARQALEYLSQPG
jgi:tetratricopeptide (TPR) repeat protein